MEDNISEGRQGNNDFDKLTMTLRVKFKTLEEKIKECLESPLFLYKDHEDFLQKLCFNLVEMHIELLKCHQKMVDEAMFKLGQELWTDWIRSANKARKYIPDDKINVCPRPGENEHQGQHIVISSMLAKAYCNRGMMKYHQVDFEGAISDYTEGLKFDAGLGELHFNRGMILYRLGFFKQALVDTEEAIRLKPDNEEYKSWLKHVKEMQNSPTGHDFELPLVGCKVETDQVTSKV